MHDRRLYKEESSTPMLTKPYQAELYTDINQAADLHINAKALSGNELHRIFIKPYWAKFHIDVPIPTGSY